MVEISTAEIKDKIWTSVCPAPVYGTARSDTPVAFWEGVRSGTLDAHRTGWVICGAFALVNTVFALTLIVKHLQHYHEPQFQRYYVRLILMIPVYSIVSFLGYRFYTESTYYELALSFYEAFVIASFFILILNFLGAEEDRTKDVLSRGRRRRFMPPICCIHFRTDGWYFLEVTKWCVLQYVVVQPLLSIAGVILKVTDRLCEASFSLQFGNAWLKIIEFFSVSIATFALIQFYLVIRQDIAMFKPLWKFVAIKLIIFLSFYQTIVLTILGYFHVIKPSQYWSVDNISHGLNSLIITVEMFLFCFLDLYAYSHREFKNGHSIDTRTGIWRASIDAFNIFDLFVEVGHNLKWFWAAFVKREQTIRYPRDHRFDIHTVKTDRQDLVRRETMDYFASTNDPPHEEKELQVYTSTEAYDIDEVEEPARASFMTLSRSKYTPLLSTTTPRMQSMSGSAGHSVKLGSNNDASSRLSNPNEKVTPHDRHRTTNMTTTSPSPYSFQRDTLPSEAPDLDASGDRILSQYLRDTRPGVNINKSI